MLQVLEGGGTSCNATFIADLECSVVMTGSPTTFKMLGHAVVTRAVYCSRHQSFLPFYGGVDLYSYAAWCLTVRPSEVAFFKLGLSSVIRAEQAEPISQVQREPRRGVKKLLKAN